jgi:hypothetical protein
MRADRYLTPAEKERALREWADYQAETAGVVGPGVQDPEIVAWCDKINALDGVCTLQSCAGHHPGEGERWMGVLWLWFDERVALAFWRRAFELAERSGIERVSTIYQPWGQEIVQIEFRGVPDGQLETSMAKLVEFLSSL